MIATDVQVAVIGAIGIVVNALAVIFTAYLNYRSSHRNRQEIRTVGANVQRIESATNSMQDKLVASTQLAAEAKGRDEERARGRNGDN